MLNIQSEPSRPWSLDELPGLDVAPSAVDAIREQMFIAAEEWLSGHRDHLDRVVRFDDPEPLEWPPPPVRVIDRLYCQACDKMHTFAVRIG